MMESPQCGPWSDLPPELLGLVLKHLPSLADRVHLRAVCHPWRSNVLPQQLPLPFPWLTLPDGSFFSIPGGEVYRMPVPDGASYRDSVDNWLFLMSSDGTCTLMNPFSKSTLELPNLVTVWRYEASFKYDPKQLLYKLVVPSPLDILPDSLVATLINDHNCSLCIYQPSIATYSLRGNRELMHLFDVAFFDGKLYAVTVFGKLLILKFRNNLGRKPKIKCIIESLGDCRGGPECIPREETCTFRSYLVECGGRLLMVERFIRFGPRTGENIFDNTQTAGFVILEAHLHSNPCRWKRISELGGHALFVGQHCSKSLPATECSGSQEDCIYFICEYPHPKYFSSPFRDCGVYNMRNGMIMPLMSQTSTPAHDAGLWRPTWFFPAEPMCINLSGFALLKLLRSEWCPDSDMYA